VAKLICAFRFHICISKNPGSVLLGRLVSASQPATRARDCQLKDCVKGDTPRLLINRERVGEGGTYRFLPGMGGGDGFDFDERYRCVPAAAAVACVLVCVGRL
jgi:hypothetical protein